MFLRTLPEREIVCGLGEIIKHGALHEPLFDKLFSNADRLFDLTFLEEIVPQNIALKADVVQKDAHETDLRKCLNMGHTTGHALELYENEEYLNDLKGLILRVLKNNQLPSACKAARFAALDKKNATSDLISFVAPVAKGHYMLKEIAYDEYVALLKRAEENLI